MGTIVLDTVEAHADRLKHTWAAADDRVGEGGLFVRPASDAVPRRRRHAVTPRNVVLSGVNAANARRLDELVTAWGVGTRSALVEQALRYEFNSPKSPVALLGARSGLKMARWSPCDAVSTWFLETV